MQLRVIREGLEFTHRLPPGTVRSVIGRKTGGFTPEIDLSPDLSVSRRHAKIWIEDGTCWVEDLGSRVGTLINGFQLQGNDRLALRPGDTLKIGKTILRLESDEEPQIPRPAEAKAPAPAPASAPVGSGDEPDSAQLAYSTELLGASSVQAPPDAAAKLLHTIQEITIALGKTDGPADVGRTLMLHVRDLVPRADNAALLMLDERSSELVLAAHEPEGDPRVSSTLARRAIEQGQGIVWVRSRHGMPGNLTASIEEQRLEGILCAPLIWQGRALGALWLSSSRDVSFTRADLGLVVAVAHHVSMGLAGRRMQEELARHSTILKRVMAHFSPKIATRLLEQARQGRLRPGGTESEVTLLCSDLRGFTKVTSGMATDDVVDLLNDYFAALVSIVVARGGTIDKFIGDAILAVFGSPEPDAEQHGNAVLAAREMQQCMKRLNEARATRKLPTLELGIGVHCGKVLHGFIGSEERLEFTLIGDPVNKTSRYCDGAGPGEVVISPELHQLVWRKVKVRRAEIQTKHEGTLPAYVLIET